MPIIRQPVDAAGGDYDGTAGKGLIEATAYVPPDSRYHFCVLNLWFNTDAAIDLLTVLTRPPPVPPPDPLDTNLIDIFDLSAADPRTLSEQCCCFCVPHPHNLIITTSGKTGDAILNVEFEVRVHLPAA